MAMRRARGDLIKFLDHDDQLTPRCLEMLVALLDDERVGIAQIVGALE
jgi:hypothetical protein